MNHREQFFNNTIGERRQALFEANQQMEISRKGHIKCMTSIMQHNQNGAMVVMAQAVKFLLKNQ